MYRYVLCCICSQVLFSSLYLFSDAMQPLTGTTIFSLRMLAMWCGLFLLINLVLPRKAFINFIRRDLSTNWKKWAIMVMGSALFGSQLWLFMWAPINGEGVNVAMGYFLFPLMMMLAGRLIWQERLSFWQGVATSCAIIGVANELYFHGEFSWTTLWVALAFPPYYLTRRAMKVHPLLGLFFDLCLIAPCCLIYLWGQEQAFALITTEWRYWILVPLLGLVSALSMFLNLLSSNHLPVKIFSMLSYLEPALLFLCAVFWLHTSVSLTSYVSYSFIWTGLIVLTVSGFVTQKHKSIKKRQVPQEV
ncbi:EamA family transporter RarD [Psittacicella gerlachiana]|uniref:Protein RarD n=1 Tax=Psittacicella gerlachiana TaxID=2028574 RepID=A0A3A1YFE5_9GAMM|nr:EamA family transporter RarD [Psittacicella gerlachiana]RIY34757.1 protein RarD [Psittacicella gerlachiana]